MGYFISCQLRSDDGLTETTGVAILDVRMALLCFANYLFMLAQWPEVCSEAAEDNSDDDAYEIQYLSSEELEASSKYCKCIFDVCKFSILDAILVLRCFGANLKCRAQFQ